MSDYEKNKFPFKKKFQSRGELSSGFGSRFFNSKSATKEEKSELKAKGMKQPTILIKSRDHTAEERANSPKTITKENNELPQPVTIATSTHSETVVQALPQPTKEMKLSVKLLENGTLHPDVLQDYLQENNDFLVIGVVGAQGVGKSTLLNLLAQNVGSSEDGQGVFGIETLSNDYSGTVGVDVFITQSRVILLDSQPFFSEAVLSDLIETENSKVTNLGTEFLSPDSGCEIQSLQLTAFLMSVCHILILVQDWFFDSNILRYILTAEMLKPTISNPEDEFVDHFPHLILLHNKAQMGDFSPQRFKKVQQVYRSIFSKTKMNIDSGMGIGTGQVLHSLAPESCGEPINLFLIPDIDEDSELTYQGHPPLEDLMIKLRSNMLGVTKSPLTHVQLNEKNWLIYCSKVWDHVKKNNFYVEYAKLLP